LINEIMSLSLKQAIYGILMDVIEHGTQKIEEHKEHADAGRKFKANLLDAIEFYDTIPRDQQLGIGVSLYYALQAFKMTFIDRPNNGGAMELNEFFMTCSLLVCNRELTPYLHLPQPDHVKETTDLVKKMRIDWFYRDFKEFRAEHSVNDLPEEVLDPDYEDDEDG
jgi:hypothetical protein